MSEEDSKELANAGSFGIRLDFETKRPMTATEVSKVIGDELLSAGRKLKTLSGLVGHVKAFVRTSSGFVKINLVDIDLGYETLDNLGENEITKGTMNLMAAAVGVKDVEVEAAIREGVSKMSISFKSILEEEHDHDHNHCDTVSLG